MSLLSKMTEDYILNQTAVIANGESLSGELDLKGCNLFGLIMPTAWTTANLTFQVSNVSGGTFQNLYDDGGNEVTVAAAASRNIAIDISALKIAPWRYLKIRSGTSGTAVNQGAARTITLVGKV